MSEEWNFFLYKADEVQDGNHEPHEPEQEPKPRAKELDLFKCKEVDDKPHDTKRRGDTCAFLQSLTIIFIRSGVLTHNPQCCTANDEQCKYYEKRALEERRKCHRREVEPERRLNKRTEIHSNNVKTAESMAGKRRHVNPTAREG